MSTLFHTRKKYQHVGAFQVTMNDIFGVEVKACLSNLQCNLYLVFPWYVGLIEDLLSCELRNKSVFAYQKIEQITVFNIFRDEIYSRLMQTQAKELYDIGMVEFSEIMSREGSSG